MDVVQTIRTLNEEATTYFILGRQAIYVMMGIETASNVDIAYATDGRWVFHLEVTVDDTVRPFQWTLPREKSYQILSKHYPIIDEVMVGAINLVDLFPKLASIQYGVFDQHETISAWHNLREVLVSIAGKTIKYDVYHITP
jgi:hypothetical protein